MTCPVCGKADGACGHQPLAFPPIHAPYEKEFNVANDAKVYLPQQRVAKGRGKPGYKGKNVVVVDETGQAVKGARSTKADESAKS